MLYPTLKLVISVQDELLLRDVTDPTKLNSVLLRAVNTARRGLEQAADLLRRQYADLDNRESHWNNPWTSHDLPGICTHGPKLPKMDALYETGLPLMQADAVAGVLDPNQRTYCVHLRSCREICSYERVHEMAHGPQPGPTTYIDHVHPVPGDIPQRTQYLWLRKLSQDGRTVIVDHSGNTVWDTISLLNNAAAERARDRRRAHALAHHALALRSKERDFSNHQALAIDRAARDGCTRCRQAKAEHLTAIAVGIALATAITDATGDTSHLEAAATSASNGDWKETNKIVSAALKTARIAGEGSPLESRDAVHLPHQLNRDASFAVSNLRMAEQCQDGTFIAEHDGYTAANHLWNCQIMAVSAARTILRHHPHALQMGAKVATAQCPHPQGREGTRREAARIRAHHAAWAVNAATAETQPASTGA